MIEMRVAKTDLYQCRQDALLATMPQRQLIPFMGRAIPVFLEGMPSDGVTTFFTDPTTYELVIRHCGRQQAVFFDYGAQLAGVTP